MLENPSPLDLFMTLQHKPKLELTWIGKDKQPQLEPRILIEDAGKSYGDKQTGNMLIHGDNLLALKALEQDFTKKIKCIYIDPPYNTGSAFTHYDDGVEHSLWLSLMRDRLQLLHSLLSADGSMWISIDDTECHALKLLCDEIFGRPNFVASIIWEKADSPRNSARQFSVDHDYILVYSKNPEWVPSRLPRTEHANSIYSNPDNDPRGPWIPGDPYANKPYSKGCYTIKGPTGREFSPPPGRFWRVSEESIRELDADGRIWWGPKGNARPSIKRYVSEVGDLVPRTLWKKEEVGSNRTSKNEMRTLFPGSESFATPKPEQLIDRILTIASNPSDWVLDSFAGSGTTGAVAQKMGRKWIMVELGDHCETHCLPRLKKVCDGTDQGGISEAVGWKGGGGFKYYELAPSLLKKDKYDNWVISEEYNANMLAAAMAKHEGFKYSPDPEVYWKHGKSSEKDYIFTTTAFVQAAFIDRIHEEMAADEHLLICCKKFSSACKGRFPNIEIKKIPSMLLGKCEFGRDDYSLNIVNMPHDPDEPDFVPAGPPKAKAKAKDNPAQRDLFGENK